MVKVALRRCSFLLKYVLLLPRWTPRYHGWRELRVPLTGASCLPVQISRLHETTRLRICGVECFLINNAENKYNFDFVETEESWYDYDGTITIFRKIQNIWENTLEFRNTLCQILLETSSNKTSTLIVFDSNKTLSGAIPASSMLLFLRAAITR